MGGSVCDGSRGDEGTWRTDPQSLEALLAHATGRDIFAQYLRTIQGDENLLFLDAVQALASGATGAQDELVQTAQHIYNTYIASGSPQEVSLPSKRKKALEKIFQSSETNQYKITKQVFEEAGKEIIKVLELDAYRRFKEADPAWVRLVAKEELGKLNELLLSASSEGMARH